MALSQRGREWAKLGPDMLIWKILQDLWDPETNPNGYISLGVAENALMHEELSSYVHNNLKLPLKGLTYGDGGSGSKELRQTMARFLNRKLHPAVPIKASHICITNGVTTGIEHLSSILGDPGDAFLLGQPYYGAFPDDLGLRPGLEVVKVAFNNTDPLSLDAISAYETTINRCHAKNQKVAGIMLCNPHNPLGRCYSRAFLVALMRLCNKHNIHLVSDEIYALSVFRTTDTTTPSSLTERPPPQLEPFTSLSSIPTESLITPSHTHILYGLSKDFGANGIRLGAIISQHNPTLHSALIPVAINSYASSLAESAATALLGDDVFTDWYIAENQRRLRGSWEIVISWAEKWGVKYGGGVCAAFFLWVDLGEVYRRERPERSQMKEQRKERGPHQAGLLVQEPVAAPVDTPSSHDDDDDDDDIDQIVNDALLSEKIFLASGVGFGSEKPGWFRIVFSQKEEYLREGLRRIERALGLS